MSYIDELNTKRQTSAQTHKEQSELSAMLGELKKMQMASLMGSQGKSTVILTDQTDLGDKLKQMVAAFAHSVRATDTTGLNEEQLSELKALQAGLESLTRAVTANKPDNTAVVKAIQALKLNVAAPIVNLPAPSVTVQERKIDFSPLQATIREAMTVKEIDTTPDRLDLSRYRAQDISENEGIQYVGFLNPEGNWYIIENDVKENKMRYVFGQDKYAKHFKQASSYVYRLLSEAVNV